MSRGESSQFIPIEYANTSRVRFDVAMPEYVDAERIGVNLKAIHTLCRIGGISHLRVNGVAGDEPERSVPQILGFTQNGEAFAGKAKVQEIAPIFDSGSLVEGPNDPIRAHSATWIDTQIKLNMDEISGRIQHEDKWVRGVRSPEAWAHYFNQAVKQGLSKEGTKHLVFGMSSFNSGLSLMNNINSILLSSYASIFNVFLRNFNPQLPALETLFEHLILRNLLWNLANYFFYHRNDYTDGSRFSLIFGPEVDRALVLKIMAKTKTLVKALAPLGKNSEWPA